MARIGISVTKTCAFRNSTQEFTNVYFYDGLAGTPSEADALALIDDVVAKEKAFHATTVTFVRGRCWLETGDKATSTMLAQKTLTGTGATTADSNVDRERAFLFRLRAGNDSRGNPVYLRKWYHVLGPMGGVTLSGGILSQTSGFSAANRTALVAAMNTIGVVDGGGHHGVLCAKSGRLPTAGQVWEAHAFLEHHQLGDMWRAQ